MRVRSLVAVATALVASACVVAGALVPAAADTGTAGAVTTVPFEVSGELPIYPKALWRNGDDGTEVREIEARLVQLGLLDTRWLDDSFGTMTRAAVRAFQRSHGIPALGYVDQYTWDQLEASTHEPTHAELYPPVPKPVADGATLDPRCMVGHVLCIDKSTRKLRYVVDGSVVLRTDVRFGAQATQTREGLFHVYMKSRYHHSRLYDSDMPYAMFFSGGQAVHYSSDFAARGYAGASHGCVNVRNKTKIAWLFDQVQIGDRVVVYWS
ncbi:MAG TPA: L,D-transpeptidase family protein [Kribbellaceae bacterium]|jgi:peptidoglycan hydrolase-like protein with peptidoglycan-binding domain